MPFGFVWQGARYEGLVTVFLEHLGAFGGAILDDDGRVVVDSEAAEQALTSMRDAIYVDGIVPPAVLTWQEEQTRFAFQNGQAVFMRNWPYAYALLQDRVAVERRRAIRRRRSMPGAAGRSADRRARRIGTRHQCVQRSAGRRLPADRLSAAARADDRAGARSPASIRRGRRCTDRARWPTR